VWVAVFVVPGGNDDFWLAEAGTWSQDNLYRTWVSLP